MTSLRHYSGTPYRALKAVYVLLTHLPDRLLHRRRHDAARARVKTLKTVRTILIVCHGNICRSPYLEAVLQRLLPAAKVTSAGFVGPGRPVPTHAYTLAAKRGLDLSAFRSRPVGRVDVREMDLVVVMDAAQQQYLVRVFGVSPQRIIVAGDLDPVNCATRAIRDPWRKSVTVFEESFDRLDRCAATIAALTTSTGSPVPLNSSLSPAPARKAAV